MMTTTTKSKVSVGQTADCSGTPHGWSLVAAVVSSHPNRDTEKAPGLRLEGLECMEAGEVALSSRVCSTATRNTHTHAHACTHALAHSQQLSGL